VVHVLVFPLQYSRPLLESPFLVWRPDSRRPARTSTRETRSSIECVVRGVDAPAPVAHMPARPPFFHFIFDGLRKPKPN